MASSLDGASVSGSAVSDRDEELSRSDLSLSEVTEECTRLVGAAASPLLPMPQTGDWVEYELVDSQGLAVQGEAGGYRLGCLPEQTPANWTFPVDACIRESRCGEVRAPRSTAPGEATVRVRLVRHNPRLMLSDGSTLDVLVPGTNLKQAQRGFTVFHAEDGNVARLTVAAAGELTLREEALLRLKVGEEGHVTGPCGKEYTLRVDHVARLEDVSLFSDGELWKLCLQVPVGSFEHVRLGQEGGCNFRSSRLLLDAATPPRGVQ